MSRKSSKIDQLKQAIIKQAAGRVAGPSDYGVGSDVARMRAQGMNPQQIGGAFDNDQKALDAKMQASDARLQQMDANRSQLARDQQEIAQWNRQKSQPQARPAQKTQADFNSEYQRRLDVNDYIQQGRAATDANNKAREAGQPLPYQGNSSNNYAGPARQSATPGAAQPPAPQQPAQGGDPYMAAQQAAMKAHPELAQSGSAHNKAFLDLVKQNGGADALRKNPALLNQLAQQSKPQTSAPTDLDESGNAIASGRAQPTSQPAASTNTQEVDDKYSNLPAGFQKPVATATQAQPAASPAPGQSVQAKTPNAPAPAVNSATQLQGGNINTGPGVSISTPGQPVQTNKPNAPAPAAPSAPTQPAQAPAAPKPDSDQDFLNKPPKDAGQPQYQQALLNAPALSPGTSNFNKPTSLSLGGGVATTGSTPLNKTSEFKEGFVFELNQIKEKRATEEAKKEKDILSHLRTELKKMSAELGDTSSYSDEQIDEFTKTAESFEKAAQAEAQRVWNGLVKELYKQGADEAFIDGMLKEAGGLNLLRLAARNPINAIKSLKGLSAAGEGATNMARTNKNMGGMFDKAKQLVQPQENRSHLERIFTDPGSYLPSWNKGIEGAKRHSWLSNMEALEPTKPGLVSGPFSENTKRMLEDEKLESLGKMQKSFTNKSNEAFQQAHQDVSRKAGLGDKDSQKIIAQMAGKNPNLSGIAEKLNLPDKAVAAYSDPAKMRRTRFGTPQSDVVDSVVEHAQNLKKQKFNPGVARYNTITPASTQPGLWERSGLGKMFKLSPGGAVGGALTGGGIGSFLAPGIGTAVGTLGGAAIGGLGAGGATVGAGLAGYYGGKELGLWGGGKSGAGGQKDIYGAPADRHRVVPFMKNQWTGAVGGALLASMIAREHGMSGPMSWLLPILGGIAGHKFLPQMMNQWKDPHGYGVHSAAGQSNINSQYPMMH